MPPTSHCWAVAVQTAARYGIGADRAVNYHADSRCTQLNYAVMSDTIDTLRRGQPLTGD